jgi:hypothetical protein
MACLPSLPSFFSGGRDDLQRTWRRSSISPSRCCHYMRFGLVDEPSANRKLVKKRRSGKSAERFKLPERKLGRSRLRSVYPPCTSLGRIRCFCRFSCLVESVSYVESVGLRIPTPSAFTSGALPAVATGAFATLSNFPEPDLWGVQVPF